MAVSYEHKLLYRHEGPLDMENLPYIVQTMDRLLHSEGLRPPFRRKVVSALIELAQNIIRYGAPDEVRPPLLSLARSEKGFVLTAKNLVHYSQEIFLRSYLTNLMEMSRDDLEKLYNTTLTEGSMSEKGGAGLGLVQVIFKADEFSYELTPADEQYSWFTVKASFSPGV